MSETLYLRISTRNIACSQRQTHTCERERGREGGDKGEDKKRETEIGEQGEMEREWEKRERRWGMTETERGD